MSHNEPFHVVRLDAVERLIGLHATLDKDNLTSRCSKAEHSDTTALAAARSGDG
ncbi:MAG: hypothetical protein KGO02_11025 [Alphaproteobacteria bacterium]|nr:hypothetical protein [Alphaproteobacteria bacterium]